MNYIKRLTAFVLCLAITFSLANVKASAGNVSGDAASANAISSSASSNASENASKDASSNASKDASKNAEATTTEIVSGDASKDATTEAATTEKAKATTEKAKATTEKAKATTEKTLLEDMSVGLHKNADGKIYYANKNGKKATGYKKVGKAEYFFGSDGYALVKKWKYVKLNGTKYKLYFGANGKRVLDVSNLMKKNTRYAIDVILNKCMIMIYAKDGNKGYTIPVKAMTCSPGLPGHDTITGTYKIRKVGTWHTLFYNSYGQYATNIHGNFLFHSVCYTKYGDHYSLSKKAYSQLGQKASHGCIRLLVKDAKWIYDHVGNIDKTTLRKGAKNTKTPLAKPTTKKIGKTSDGRYYDPTDPNIKKQV